ncbi:hypothetical protein OF375_02965 [Ureaplasma miroungigenitalium]|uniref:hypothetical protein n=1 Tax=Ureaplasma miroungigenitalium TaxID=1042321 RepID=UPI0021E82697|nr:hypothetical protein [Ureaplasma miroungigenitalium]MCV3734526.1 hypothetical protein [Ureaplasma miroungigenitalium]
MRYQTFEFNYPHSANKPQTKLLWKQIVRDYFNIKKTSSSQLTYNIAMGGLILAFFLIARFITKNLDFLNGSSWQLQMAVLVIGLMVIPNFYYKLFFLILAPICMLIIGFGAEPFLGYLFPHYCFAGFLFFDLIILRINFKRQTKHQTAWAFSWLIIFSIIAYFAVWIFYSTQGYLFYGVDWIGSMIYNATVVFGSLAINIWITLLFIRPMNEIKKFMVAQHLKY